ncbi:MAG TPA: hypothetical protein DCX07_12235 [Phycisphaerales bacterium]|nr:hypothetical protein [Phycisphaerales bacterium]
MKMSWILTSIAACLVAATARAAEPLTLVEKGKSAYSIYHEPAAPDSVKEAAREIQTYVAKATGARLPLVTTFPDTPVIALGAHPQLQANGLSVEGIPLEGYRIVTKGKNLFIFGPDTLQRQYTPLGGFSRGTQNGVYTFLETVFGIRWLMPGDAGDVVPRAETVTLPPTDLTDAPDFRSRRLPYIRERDPKVQQWMRRNKLGYSILLVHGHQWHWFEPDVYDRAPEMFTLHKGKRIRPVNAASAWICTTNPKTIAHFRAVLKNVFAANPAMVMNSISPSDGSELWCECEQCTALDEKLPNGEVRHTRRIVAFYNAVTQAVSEVCPDKLLAGYVYAGYVDPPLDRTLRFHPNFYPVLGALFAYGPLAYRPDVRERLHACIDGWSAMTDHLSYYGFLPLLQPRGRFALPIPPERKLLKDLFPALKKARMCGIYIYGQDAWGHAAALNWVTARLLWRADADVDALCEEFYAQCYGKGGPAMSKLYGLLEDQTEKYIVNDRTATYHMQPKAIRAIYLPVYDELEAFYKQAHAAADTPETRRRLELFGMNMRGLYRVLEDYGWLKNRTDSVFYMPEPEFIQWVESQKASLYINPGAMAAGNRNLAAALRTPLTVAAYHDALPSAEPVRPFLLRYRNHLVLQANQDGEIRMDFSVRQTAKGGEMAYKVYDAKGTLVTSGMAAETKEVVFPARKGELFHVFLETSMLSVSVTNAAWAIDTQYSPWVAATVPRLHLVQKVTPLYFFVPKGVEKFTLGLFSTAPGETCAAVLYDPSNKPAARFDTSAKGEDSQTVAAGQSDGGFWKLDLVPAKTGVIDDVWIELGKEIPGYVSPDPANRLSVEIAK